MPTDPVFPVRFDPDALDDDLLHVTPLGRQVAAQARTELERDGIPASRLYRCGSEMTDGTDLGGCVKTRIPWPDGRWGIVMYGRVDRDGHPELRVLAFGERHPAEHWRASVYQLAHRRLHAGA